MNHELQTIVFVAFLFSGNKDMTSNHPSLLIGHGKFYRVI